VVENKTPTGPTAMQLRRPDGETRSIRVSTAPGNYHGRNIGQAVVVDVTRLKNVQAKLEAEREFIEDAMNALQDIFYVIDPGGELVRWNETLVERSGYDESEVEERDVEEFFVEEDVGRVSESIATAFVEGEDVLEATVVTKHGNEIPYEFRKHRLSRGGDVVGLVGIGRDVSDRKARDQHLHAVDRLLQDKLRNQVNVIRGRADAIRSDEEGDDAEHLDRIETASERLLSLFDDHRHIVTLLTEREGVEPTDAVAVVESAIRNCKAAHPTATISGDLPAHATVSAHPMLERAVCELIDNAVEHGESREPSVDVVVEAGEDTVTIRVVDDGPGMPRMEYTPLAESDALSSTFHSTGLGLWLVHWTVTRSGGSLDFDRGHPRGNAVTVELRTPSGQWVE
jgi:PAS domain S-box-containing protein